MRLIYTLLILAALLLAPLPQARAYTLQYTSTTAATQIHWPTTTVTVALSTSLSNPPPFVHATGAQVVLAARRALSRWSLASNIQFNVTTSANQDAVADGVSLITVADTGNNRLLFNTGLRPGRARVTFDPATGSIRGWKFFPSCVATRYRCSGGALNSANTPFGVVKRVDPAIACHSPPLNTQR